MLIVEKDELLSTSIIPIRLNLTNFEMTLLLPLL